MNYQTNFKNKIIDKFVDENYYNMSDLNWKDDTLENGIGDIDGSDPSIKGFNKGWQMDPYSQRYYANYDGGKKMSRLKKAVVEIRDITYSAENYVDELLSIWKESDGSIQDFFDAFTSNNKVNNRDKKDMARLLNERGYKVSPWLLDETVRHANVQYFRDMQLSDESLENMEEFLSGMQEPLSLKGDNGFNQTCDMYSDLGGPAPTNYEISANKVSRLKKKL